MRKIKSIICIILIFSFTLTLTACEKNDLPFTGTGYYFDTIINFCFYGTNAETAIDKCILLAAEYDDLWNKNKPDSDIYHINSSNGNPVEVSPVTIELLNIAVSFANISNGTCTPTIGALSSLWDFKSTNPSLPDSALISESLKHIDISSLSITDNTVTLTDPMAQIDLGFLAKGFAADKMKELAINCGVTSGWINLGGNVLAIGQKPDGNNFNIGIQNPSDNSEGSITIVPINDCSVVTSGVYERCFTLDGVNYYHILDTKTGYPIRNNLLSVSVIGPSSAICDGLSTTLFVLGIKEGNILLSQYSGYSAIYITDELEIIYSTDTE